MAAEPSGEGKEVRSEDELGVKWDRCVADTIIKTGEDSKMEEGGWGTEGERGKKIVKRRKREKGVVKCCSLKYNYLGIL